MSAKTRLLHVVAALSILAAVLPATPLAATRAAGNQALVLHQEPFEASAHDLEGDGIGPGDLYTWIAPVTADDGRSGTVVGEHVVVVTPTDGPFAEVRIGTSVIDLGDGDTIALGGLIPVSAGPIDPGTELVNAIIGGTGAFGGAKGEIRSVRAEDGSWAHTLAYETAGPVDPARTVRFSNPLPSTAIVDLAGEGTVGPGDFRVVAVSWIPEVPITSAAGTTDGAVSADIRGASVLVRGPGDDGSPALVLGYTVLVLDGDQLAGVTYQSVGGGTGPLAAPTTLRVVGGTGRFAGARGSWTAVVADEVIEATIELLAPSPDAVERTLVMRSALPAAGSIDRGDPGESFGDWFTFSLPFTGEDESGTAYGYGSTVIPAADGSPVRTLVGLISVQLGDGSTILVADLHTEDTAIPRAEDAAVTRPVLGGTGRFAGVTGELVTTLDGQGGLVHTFHLVGPAA